MLQSLSKTSVGLHTLRRQLEAPSDSRVAFKLSDWADRPVPCPLPSTPPLRLDLKVEALLSFVLMRCFLPLLGCSMAVLSCP